MRANSINVHRTECCDIKEKYEKLSGTWQDKKIEKRTKIEKEILRKKIKESIDRKSVLGSDFDNLKNANSSDETFSPDNASRSIETRILLTENNSGSFTNVTSNYQNISLNPIHEKTDSVTSTIKRKASEEKSLAKTRPANPPKSSIFPVQKDSKSRKASSGPQQSNKITSYFDTW